MSGHLRELIGAARIERRVDELALLLNQDYADRDPIFVGVLKGAFIFLADLLRRLDFSPSVDFLSVSSYGSATETSGVVQIRKDVETAVAGRSVLLIEDIVDSGLTVSYLMRHFKTAGAASVEICCLLDKPSRRRVVLQPHYIGFAIEDRFVVGYGLDYGEQYRQLPNVCELLLNETAG